MMLCTLSCLVLLCAAHSFAFPSPGINTTQRVIGEDASKWLDKAQVDQKFADAINTLAKVLNGSKSCQHEKTMMPLPTNCQALFNRGETQSGVYTVYSNRSPDGRPIKVYCDMETDDGGWLVFQRRKDESQDFLLGWEQYSAGFGDLNGEFWLGNRKLNLVTSNQLYELRVDMKAGNDVRYARYGTFVVGPESDKFRLTVGDYSGSAGDSMNNHNGHMFSTVDQDNDDYSGDCAASFKGGWWYNQCHLANLNGLYLNGPHTSFADGIDWYTWKGHYYSLQFTELKMRPL